MYYAHNLDFIRYARSMQGRKADALKASDTLSAAVAPMAEAMPEMADVFTLVPRLTLLRFQQWDAVLQLPKPKDAQKIGGAVWHYMRALAFAAKNDKTAAARERAEFETARAQIPATADWGQNKSKDVLAMASEIVAAKVAGDEVAHLRRAVELQDAFVYDEPPAWYYPVRESLGAALLRANQPVEAEKVFREGVRLSPKNGRMLFGLLAALKTENKFEEASWVQKEFDAAWSKADIALKLEDM